MHLIPGHAALAATIATACFSSLSAAQTFTDCNPLTAGNCPPDPALGKSESFDFTSGGSSSFASVGPTTYGSNGAAFTVAKTGDAPQINSNFYIMFGHVDFEIQAAPGVGIVSSAVLQSDCLDEIDWEWLGGDGTQVQSNYFGKGDTSTYNRAQFHPDPDNHSSFHKYSIDWTSEQIVWQIDGVTVRAMPYADADPGQYPQTPMMIKVGAWSGGDPSNPPGTIEWAGGETNYAAGPFTMYLRSMVVTDYSTGTKYTYSGSSGTWQSIISSGGKINGNLPNQPIPVASASPSMGSAPTNSLQIPPGGIQPERTSSYVTHSIWPWVGTATAVIQTGNPASFATSISGLPSGWTVSPSGKVVPPSEGAMVDVPLCLTVFSLVAGLSLVFLI